jgi:hypothetical protein
MSKRIAFAFVPEYFVLGLSCHQKDYKLAWELNRTLRSDFERLGVTHDVPDELKGLQSLFRWTDDERYAFYLLGNRQDEGLFAPEWKQADYFFIITGLHEQLPTADIKSAIDSSNGVLASFRIDPAKSRTFKKIVSI